MMRQYRNLATGELAPAHWIGQTEDGDELYQCVAGWEPTFEYWLDQDGNWVTECAE